MPRKEQYSMAMLLKTNRHMVKFCYDVSSIIAAVENYDTL
jgi:hypothetical protein